MQSHRNIKNIIKIVKHHSINKNDTNSITFGNLEISLTRFKGVFVSGLHRP
jgi:hypothetical protein